LRKIDAIALFETIPIDFAEDIERQFKVRIRKAGNSANPLAPSQRTLTERRVERSERENGRGWYERTRDRG